MQTMQCTELSQVLTVEAAAKLYEGTALTQSAIRRLVRSGEIPSRKVGAKYLITIFAIENWLNGGVFQPRLSDYGTIRPVSERLITR